MQNIYELRHIGKLAFLVISLILVTSFLYISKDLVENLSKEERNRMEIWASATRELASGQDNGDMGLILQIIQSNTTIPIIITDGEGEIRQHLNISLPSKDMHDYLQKRLTKLQASGNVIEIFIDRATRQYLYYDDSTLLKKLSYYPYVQLGVMIIFMLITFFALSSSKRAEQNKVWVGLSKETAHQLGTPISSLMAWTDLLELNGVDNALLDDMRKDVQRLFVIAERFSKVGSHPELELTDTNILLENAMSYMQARVSKRVNFTLQTPPEPTITKLSPPLFEWVVENLCKNAIDAMDGIGSIDILLKKEKQHIIIEVKDSGKGVAKKNFKTIFNPGYTTKKRGWGLGLTLVKRIVEEYHGGKIFVKESTLGEGTTMRIELHES